MRVLGITEEPDSYGTRPAYVVQVTEDELKKVANKAGYRDEFPKLKPGQDYPLAEGYDFRAEIVEATRRMQGAYEQFVKASQTMTRFAAMVAEQEER